MTTQKETIFSKDAVNKKLFVEREFDAPVHEVWKAWTESDLLDQWWAPRPWKAETKKMDFREGGFWLYAMVGPDGSKQWCRTDFETIVPGERFAASAAFCDENGIVNNDIPRMHWNNHFLETGSGTKVKVEITFSSEEDMQKIIEMGFKEGFTMAHGNLDELLAKP